MSIHPVIRKLYYFYVGLLMSYTSRRELGTNVYDRDWDVLILLDTCRVDALRSVADEYNFLEKDSIESMWSVGSASVEWMAETFQTEHEDEIRNTAYISANGFTQRVFEEGERPDDGRGWSYPNWATVDADQFQLLDQPFLYTDGHSEWYTEPRPVTERGVAVSRKIDPNRMILHYSQPHHPYAANARAEGRTELEDHEKNPFEQLRSGHELEPIWNAYLDQLREVLDEVEIVLNNIDAKTVAISADHGEGFGELGFIYGHPIGILHPSVRKVPWVTTSATDKHSFESTLEPPSSIDSVDERTNKRLEQLGYLE